MMLWEIDWTDGKQYKGYHPYHTEQIWTVKDGSLVNTLGSITELYNLEIISQFDFEPWVDWSKVAIDTKVTVSDEGQYWYKSYFAKYEDGKIFVFPQGGTSWSKNDSRPLAWKYAKLAEGEE